MNPNIFDLINQIQSTETLTIDQAAIESAYQKRMDQNGKTVIQVLSIIGGILGALSFLGFLVLFGLFDSDTAPLVVGLGFIILAIAVNIKVDSLLIDTTSVSIYIIGFFVLGFGLMEWNLSENGIIFCLLAGALLSLAILQTYVMPFIAFLIMNGCFLALIITNEAYNLIHLFIGLNAILLTVWTLAEAKIISSGKRFATLYSPIRMGLIISLLTGLGFLITRNIFRIPVDFIYVAAIILIPLILFMVSKIIAKLKVEKSINKALIYGATTLLLVPTIFAPSIAGAILVLLLCYYVNYKTGFAFGLAAFIYFFIQYYYDLNFTLLEKSLILFSAGILFLICYFFLHKTLESHEKI